MADQADFVRRYGAWGIFAGASEGLGAEYAEELAARGLNLVLIARRAELLQSFASQLCQKYQVAVKMVVLDLSAPEAAERIAGVTGDLEVGLLVYNAAFSAIGPFLEPPLEDHLKEIHTNAFTPLKLVYLFARQMLARGRGGIVLMSSLSAFQGSAYISTYAADQGVQHCSRRGVVGGMAPAGSGRPGLRFGRGQDAELPCQRARTDGWAGRYDHASRAGRE